jgi:hypothetical protein
VAVVSPPSSRAGTASGGALRTRAAQPRSRAAGGAPVTRIRWDRVGRVAMLVTLLALLYLAISPVRSLIADVHLSAARHARLAELAQQGAALAAQERTLSLPGTRQIEARNLGMVRSGERSFVVYGLPDN